MADQLGEVRFADPDEFEEGDEGEEYEEFSGEEGVEDYASEEDYEEDAEGQAGASGEIDEEADDEEEQPAAGAGPAGQDGQQMLYIPGLGYIPLANFPGLGGAMGRGGPAPTAAPTATVVPEGEREWTALHEFPRATQEGLLNALSALREDGRSELTLLVLGKGGVGKSSTINSLLNERAANVLAFQQDNAKPTVYSRHAAGFTLHCVDTPSLLDQDVVSDAKLEAISKAVRERDVDAVLYLDRLDSYKVDLLEKKVLEGISRVLGPEIWHNAVLGFTRGSESSAPPGLDFHDYVAQRAAQLREAIAQTGVVGAELPVALIENSSRCPTNEEGERVVPGEVPWIVDLVEKVAEVALNYPPFLWSPQAAAKAANPNRRRKWLIPLVLAAQVALKLLLDRVMDEDGCRGDTNGPFDAQTAEERREELRREKEEQRRKRERQRKAAAAAPAAASQAATSFDDFEEEEFDDEDDDF